MNINAAYPKKNPFEKCQSNPYLFTTMNMHMRYVMAMIIFK